jgi:hypothetical protein
MTLHHHTTRFGGQRARAEASSDGRQGVDRVEELAREHRSIVVLARSGWFAKGVVYALVGILAFKIALDPGNGATSSATSGGNGEASQTGAISEIARSSAGELALWAVGIGLLLYVLWRIVSILLPAQPTAKAWVTRVGYGVSALVYAFLAFSAISFARNGGQSAQSGQSENARVEKFTRDLMDSTSGRWLVGGIGILLVGVALFFLYRALTAEFEDELAGGVGPVSRHQLVRLGQIGWVGRSAMMGLIGAFLVRAAVEFDPAEAEGLDGALHRVADTSWGPFAVALVGVGLILYGAYCMLSAPVQRLKSAG